MTPKGAVKNLAFLTAPLSYFFLLFQFLPESITASIASTTASPIRESAYGTSIR